MNAFAIPSSAFATIQSEISIRIKAMKAKKALTQKEHILAHLKQHGIITPIEALNLYGCFRLAARIHDLVKDGHAIHSRPWITPGGARVSRYSYVGYPPRSRQDQHRFPQ